jgi:hypothetical protein
MGEAGEARSSKIRGTRVAAEDRKRAKSFKLERRQAGEESLRRSTRYWVSYSVQDYQVGACAIVDGQIDSNDFLEPLSILAETLAPHARRASDSTGRISIETGIR